ERVWNRNGGCVTLPIQQRSSWRNNSARTFSTRSCSRANAAALAEASDQRSEFPANSVMASDSSLTLATFAEQSPGSDRRNDAIAVPSSVHAIIGKPQAR